MSQLSYDDEDYYFQISDELESDKEFVLIIYDIVDNRKRVKLAKLLSGYGKRVQKSAFEAMLTTQRYNKLIEEIPRYIDKTEDNVRIYKITVAVMLPDSTHSREVVPVVAIILSMMIWSIRRRQ